LIETHVFETHGFENHVFETRSSKSMSASGKADESTRAPLPRKKRRSFSLFISFSAMLIFVAAAAALYAALRPETLHIAVGPPGSDDQRLIQALAQTFARERSAVRLSVIVTDGPAEGITLLGASKTDLAVARGDLEMPPDAQSVAILRKNVVVLWAPSATRLKRAKKSQTPKIKSLPDLAGHRIGVIGTTETNVTLLHVILSESGIPPDKVQVVQFGTKQIGEMARDQTIDAFMAVGPLNSKITAEAIAATARERGDPQFLPIEVSEAIAQRHPLYESEEIPAATFGSSPARPDDKIETVGVNHLIVARRALSETVVAAFTRQLFAVRRSLEKEFPGAADIETPDTDKDATLPAHRGAAAYIDGTERTFLEKYSDYMWGAILLLSGLGSAGAWLRSYLKRGEKAQTIALRDRLLALIIKARDSNSADELRDVQREVDDILREILNSYDDGALQEGDLSAFRLAFEQFQHAVTVRHAAMDNTTSDVPRFRTRQ
jgi:TRAP transporter TAXI family solute receptor